MNKKENERKKIRKSFLSYIYIYFLSYIYKINHIRKQMMAAKLPSLNINEEREKNYSTGVDFFHLHIVINPINTGLLAYK